MLFNLAAVTSTRTLAAAAHTGSGSVWLWVSACVLFFVPSALCVVALSRKMPEEGGLYVWTRESFGPWHGFLCGTCYWLNNLFYFPSLLLAGAAMSAYTLGERGAAISEMPVYALTLSVAVLWGVTLLNIRGLSAGKWLGNLGGLSTFATGGLVVALAVVALAMGKSATAFDWSFPSEWDKLNFWPQIAFAFGGLELGAVMGGEVHRPERTIPRAARSSGALITGFYLAGTVGLLVLLRPEAVSPVTGLTQAAAAGGGLLGFAWLSPLTALLLAVGIFGQFSVWMAGSARLPLVLGIDRFLPASFARPHERFGTPWVALLFQATGCTVFLLVMHAGEFADGLPVAGGHDGDHVLHSVCVFVWGGVAAEAVVGSGGGVGGDVGGDRVVVCAAGERGAAVGVCGEAGGRDCGDGGVCAILVWSQRDGMKTYPDSVRFLYSLGNEVKTIKMGLERIQALMGALGHPERAYAVVHVAGTNGKGSTCAMIEAGLWGGGAQDGADDFAAPHRDRRSGFRLTACR